VAVLFVDVDFTVSQKSRLTPWGDSRNSMMTVTVISEVVVMRHRGKISLPLRGVGVPRIRIIGRLHVLKHARSRGGGRGGVPTAAPGRWDRVASVLQVVEPQATRRYGRQHGYRGRHRCGEVVILSDNNGHGSVS